MIFLVHEDRVVSVVATVDEANGECEPYDAEAGTCHFFDDAGRQLIPVFPHRNTRRFLGMRVDDDPGAYELQPAVNSTDLIVKLFTTGLTLDRNPWFASLDDMKAHFRKHGHPSI